ncbi:hypothetical protein [Flavobacterium sp.]|uniref:hypothetical protein n=1 Tax=Flavobacterium sp. TaxID=239 RepID=UPI00260C7F8E|nr:hypothetical protein [Flavobacterium sp.]
MRKLLLFFLITVTSFSQNKSLTIEQIDSICLKSKKNIEEKFEIERDIAVSRTKSIKVRTEALLKIYKISNLDTINEETIAPVDSNYPIRKPQLIKATYEYETISYKKSVEYVFVELYYENDKIKSIRVKNRYNDNSYTVFTNYSSLKKDNDITYFSFCQSFNNWVDRISLKINNIFYERKWQ